MMSTRNKTRSQFNAKSPAKTSRDNLVQGLYGRQRGFTAETQPRPMQTKLKMGQPGDKCEQEADRMAERIMTMPGPALQLNPG